MLGLSNRLVTRPFRRRRFQIAAIAALVALAVAYVVDTALADPASPITVVKTASANPVASGTQETYTIVVTNTSGAALKSLVLTDQINGIGTVPVPPGLPQLTITSSQGSCTQGGPNGNLVTCQGGNMNGGGVWTVTIGGQVTAAGGTVLNNTASVTGTKSAQNFTTLSNALQVPVTGGGGPGGGLPDLTINKTGPTSVAPSSPMTYTLTVNNLGTANASNIKVVDTLPAGVTGVTPSTITTTSLFTCATTGTNPITVTCIGGAVNQGQNGTITINGISPSATGNITNTAAVDPDNTIVESNELNNTSALVNTSVSGPPPTPLLTIQKTDGNSTPPVTGAWTGGAGPDPVNPGQVETYKILVTNNASGGGNSTATDVTTTDSTQGLIASSITATQTITNGTAGTTGGCTVSAPQVKCYVKSLNAGGTVLVTITGTVIQTAGSSIFDTATVTGNIKNQGVSNTASEVTTVRPQYDLTITKQGTPNPVCANSWPVGPHGSSPAGHLLGPPVCLGGLDYKFVVGNSGISDLNGNVVVRDPLPAGVTFDSFVAGGGFTCSADASQVVTCTGGSVPHAGTVTIDIIVVPPSTTGTITNTATVDPNNTIFEADETNNTASVTTTVTTGIDLTVWKGDAVKDPPGDAPAPNSGFDPIATSGTETYTIIVDNLGTQDATGIKVVDALPAGTKFLSAGGNQGFTCTSDNAPTGGNVTCVGGHIPGTETEFYNVNGAPPPNHVWATITIKVFATPFVQPTMHNEVRVDPDNSIAEVNEQNNLATDDTTVTTGNAGVGSFNQLTITKTQVNPVAGNPVATNGTLQYNLKVDNLGTDPVSNVVVQDFLPSGSRFISAIDSGAPASAQFFCSQTSGTTITCSGGMLDGTVNHLPGGVPPSRTILVTIFAPNTPGTYTNTAIVDPNNAIPEGNEFDNSSSVSTQVTVGGNNMFNELTVTKTQTDPVPPTAVATFSPVTYHLDVTNSGSDPAFNVEVKDVLPAGFTFISAIDNTVPGDPHNFNCSLGAANTIDCTGATLDGTVNHLAGEPSTRTIEVKAFSSTVPGTYTNTAIVDPSNAIPEGNETNNTSTAQTMVKNGGAGPWIDLKMTKKQISPDPTTITSVAPGGQITYDLNVQNIGSQDAFNVTARDILPQHTTLTNAFDSTGGPGSFICASNNGVVNCTGGTIPGGGARHITVIVTVDTNIEPFVAALNAVSLNITNQAFVDPDNVIPEGDESNNTDSVNTLIQPRINLTVKKTGPQNASQNDNADYTITVTNNKVGPTGDPGATAHGVLVVDNLPIGLIPLSWTADGNFQCQIFENPVNYVSCVGDLAAGATATITVHTFVTANGGTLDNQACVDPNNTITESDETDNCVDTTTTIFKLAPNLIVDKQADVSTASPGQTITYTVSVFNAGVAPAAGPIVLTDKLDTSKVDFVSAASSDGTWTCSFSTPNVTCQNSGSLGIAAGTIITLKVTVKAGATGTLANTASVPNNTPFDSTDPECSGSPSICTNEGDPNSLSSNADNTSTANVTLGGSGVNLKAVSFSDNPDPTNVGGLVTYTGVVQNTGTLDQTGIVVRTVLPATDVNFVSASGTNGFTCVFTTPNVDCTGDLPAGGSATFTTVVTDTKVPPPPAHDTSITTQFQVDPSNAITETDETDNNKSETTSVQQSCNNGCIDLAMSPIVTSPAKVAPDGMANFTIGVANAGDTTSGAFDITLKLETAGDFDFGSNGFTAAQPSEDYSASPGATTGFNCTFPLLGDTVTCHGDLNAGQSVVIQLHVHINATPAHTAISLQAAADPSNAITESNEANNTATASIPIGT